MNPGSKYFLKKFLFNVLKLMGYIDFQGKANFCFLKIKRIFIQYNISGLESRISGVIRYLPLSTESIFTKFTREKLC